MISPALSRPRRDLTRTTNGIRAALAVEGQGSDSEEDPRDADYLEDARLADAESGAESDLDSGFDSGVDYGDEREERDSELRAKRRDAERKVAAYLGLTLAEAAKLRSALADVNSTICFTHSVKDALREALRRLVPDHGLDGEEQEQVVDFADAMAERVALPMDAIDAAFYEMQEVSGGAWTRMSTNVRSLLGIGMLVRIASKVAEYRTQGTTQLRGMQLVLATIGLDLSAAILQARQVSSQSAVESAMADGRALAERLNSLPESDRLIVLFHNLCGLRAFSRRLGGGVRRGASERNRSLFDDLPAKGEAKTARAQGAVHVVVQVVQSALQVRATLPNEEPDSFPRFKPGDSGWRLAYSEDGWRGDLRCTHRAASRLAPPTPEAVMREMLALLLRGRDPHDARGSAQLKRFAASLEGPRASALGGMPVGTRLAVKYNQVCHGVGRTRPLGRIHDAWLCVDAHTTLDELTSLLVPPWLGFETGKATLYVMPPGEDSLWTCHASQAREAARRERLDAMMKESVQRAAREREEATRLVCGTTPSGNTSKRKLRPAEQDRLNGELGRISDELKETRGIMERIVRASPTSIKAKFPPAAWPEWHDAFYCATDQYSIRAVHSERGRRALAKSERVEGLAERYNRAARANRA
jgi:hypothetical protein